MRHLPARVHAGVGAPGHDQRGGVGQPQHLGEGRAQLTLDGAPAGLAAQPLKSVPS